MIRPVFLLGFVLLHMVALSQRINNGGFETDLSKTTAWDLPVVSNLTIARDDMVFHSGRYSLRMTNTDKENRLPQFSQTFPIAISSPRKMEISVWMKTKGSATGASMECTKFGNDDKEISFTGTYQQQCKLKDSTSEWTKVKLVLLLNPKIKKLKLQCYFNGTGTVWFDDASIIDITDLHLPVRTKIKAYMDTLVKDAKRHAMISEWKRTTKRSCWRVMSLMYSVKMGISIPLTSKPSR